MTSLPHNFLHSGKSKILELRIQVHQQELPSGGRIDGNNTRRCVHVLIENDIRQGLCCDFVWGTGLRPSLVALSKVGFWRSLSIVTFKSSIAFDITGRGVPVNKFQIFLAYFYEMAARDLDFH